MIIKNPTKNRIAVKIFGVDYDIAPEGTLENVPEAAARYWQENLHKFLVLRKDKEVEETVQAVDVAKVVEPVAPVTEDVVDEDEEQVQEVKVESKKK